jgi:hypothetical protein
MTSAAQPTFSNRFQRFTGMKHPARRMLQKKAQSQTIRDVFQEG